MKVLSGRPASWERPEGETSLSVGVFDGVHTGHRQLLEQAFAGPGLNTVVTFDPHPIEVLVPGARPRLLTTIDERIELFEKAGADLVAVLDLEDVRYLEPEEFVQSVLVDKLNVSRITVGTDFQFGRDRSGDVRFLAEFGEQRGIEVRAIELVGEAGRTISSSRIRDLIEAGAVGEAAELLGMPFRLTNVIGDGDKRGRTIGFPTANLQPPPRKCLPADGVYATRVTIRGELKAAATNVGVRPTFGGGERLVEAHILDFDDDIYGEQLTIEFISRIRPELRFESVEELVSNMSDDVARTRELLDSVMG